MSLYECRTGAKINKEKTEILLLGKWTEEEKAKIEEMMESVVNPRFDRLDAEMLAIKNNMATIDTKSRLSQLLTPRFV